MNLKDAIKALDEVIPPPDNKMVDAEHSRIAFAWQAVRDAVLTHKDEESQPLLIFSKRGDLAEAFKKWASENGVKDCPFSVVTFLYSCGLINIGKALEFIEEQKEEK